MVYALRLVIIPHDYWVLGRTTLAGIWLARHLIKWGNIGVFFIDIFCCLNIFVNSVIA